MSKTYNTEIISVGTELLLGHVTNTDARDVSELLSKIGINVLYHTVVGDNPQRLEDCVKIARERADIIITTGGLGPTCDDLTKEILARAFDVKLVEDKREMDTLYDYINLGKKLTDNNFRQALLPEGCTVFHNTAGTAPGCAFEKDGKVVVMLPGPPKECRIMLEKSAIPYLRQLSDEKIVSHTINIFGIGESAVDDIFAGEMNAMTNPSMAPYAKECDCLLKVTAKAHTEAEAEEMLRPVMAEVQEKLGEVVYGVDVDCIEQSVLKLLREKNMTFSAAESCTGGLIAKRITDVPGASGVFECGWVTYADRAKTEMLGVPEEVLKRCGAVSEPVVKAMAEGALERSGADVAVAVSGIAGPGGGTPEKPVGTVWLAWAFRGGKTRTEMMLYPRDRASFRKMVSQRALAGLLDARRKEPVTE